MSQIRGVVQQRYQELLQVDIREQLNEIAYKYRKNDQFMFRRLAPFTSVAIDRAERGLRKQQAVHGQDCAAMNPATCLHMLVRELLAYMRKGQ